MTQIMGYEAVAFGPQDLKVATVDLLQLLEVNKVKGQTRFVGANLKWNFEGFCEPFRIIEVGKHKIGVTAILGNQFTKEF